MSGSEAEDRVIQRYNDAVQYYNRKKLNFLATVDDIHTIALGSSHGDYAFNPTFLPHSYNFCSISQDLRYSSRIFEFALSNSGHLKNVVLFYSEFSYGFDKSVSGESYRGIIMDRVFGFPHGEHEQEHEIWQKIDVPSREEAMQFEQMGFFHASSPSFMGPEFTAEKRARAHFRLSAASENAVCQHEHLLNIIEAAIRHGLNIIIVIPPLRSDYADILPPTVNIFGPLYDIGRKYKVNVLNLLTSNEFHDSDFGDADHLHPWGNGSRIVMEKIRGALGQV